MRPQRRRGTVKGMNVVLILQLIAYLRHRWLPKLLFLVSLLFCPCGTAQTTAPPTDPPPRNLPTAPPPAKYVRPTYYPYAGVFCGIGATTSSAATKPTAGCGVGFTFVPLPIYTEVGVMGPQANRSDLSGYVSVDTSIPLAGSTAPHLPLILIGYSRLFETGHAFDYGLALVMHKPGSGKDPWASDIRLELRDYWTFANPAQHNVMLRVGLITFESD